MWYAISPASGISMVAADTTEASSISGRDPFYVLLIGSDTRRGTALYTGNAGEEGQELESADVLTLVRIDPSQRQLTLLTIPSDTLSYDDDVKLGTWLREGNPTRLVEEVEKILGVQVPYYFLVTFTGFEKLVDAAGGVTVDVYNNATILDPSTGTEVTVKSGKDQHLDGAQALAIASNWESSEELEVLRQIQVRDIERALIEQVALQDEGTIRRILAVFNNCVTTNMEDSLLVGLALDYAAHKDDYTIYSGSGPYQGHRLGKSRNWVVDRNDELWAEIMGVVDSGGDPNTVIRLHA